MKIEIFLPRFLNPYKIDGLIRVGKANDGGYIVNSQDVLNTKHLISLGVSFDYSFEKNFLNKNTNIKIRTYDGSVGFRYYIKKLKYRIKVFLFKPNSKNLQNIIEGLIEFLKFSIFYKFNVFSKIKHIEKFVIKDTKNFFDFEKNYGYKAEFIEFKEVISKKLKSVFLSIDIEGGEYELLDEICALSKNLTGLIIEFHNVQKNLKLIESFIKKIDLVLIHTHVNNFGPILNGVPSVIELSFSKLLEKNSFEDKQLVNNLPINLDQPNNVDSIDYLVSFK